MRLRKKLVAAVLAVIMAVPSVQVPGRISYASETEIETEKPTRTEIETETEKPTRTETETETEKPTSTETETETEKPTSTETETETEKPTSTETEETTETEELTETEETTQTEEEKETEETTETDFDEADALNMDFPEGPYGEIPFEIEGKDIFAGLDDGAVYYGRVSAFDPKYDPRETDSSEMTPAKNQGSYGTCWAFAAMEILQNSMIRNGLADNTIDLSERQLAYFAYNTGHDALDNANDDTIVSTWKDSWLHQGGNVQLAAIKLMNWHGGAYESTYPYSNAVLTRANAQTREVTAHDIYFVPTRDATTEDRKTAVKELICRYGSVAWSYYSDNSCYNTYDNARKKVAYYCSDQKSTNHAITIVGWDDNFPVSNFRSDKKRPAGNGAWIVKNSWGAAWGENGYFYISYEDTSLGSTNPAAAMIAAPKGEYDNNYFYGNTSRNDTHNGSKTMKVAHVFTVKGAEELKAVSMMLSSDKTDYSVQVYKNPEMVGDVVKNPETGNPMLATPVTGKTGYAGVHTIDLENPVALSAGDRIAIVIELKKDAGSISVYVDESYIRDNLSNKQFGEYTLTYTNTTQPGQSFLWSENAWHDTHDTKCSDGKSYNFRINALTKNIGGSGDKTRYNITYVLNGGTNDSSNPSTYTSDTGTITLRPATKTGYSFEGWYEDTAYKKPIVRIPMGSTGNITLYAKWMSMDKFTVALEDGPFVYSGTELKPNVNVLIGGVGELVKDMDYELVYENNINAGTAKVTVKGKGTYNGKKEEQIFAIERAPLTIKARDVQLLGGDLLPSSYEYDIFGLKGSDSLRTEPKLSCNIENTNSEGEYTIAVSGADAGPNYNVNYQNGTLRVIVEQGACKVTFDTRGKGKAPEVRGGIRVGATIKAPEDPEAKGYRFDGWYKDAACTKKWDFDRDTVQADMTLYAKWLKVGGDDSLWVEEIADQYYKGSALKPAVSVYAGERLLKSGSDYTLKYYNNINASVGNTGDSLPRVEITGMGGYDGKLKVNFNILRASLSDGKADLAVKENMTKSTKQLSPFISLKYGGKDLKRNTDFTVSLKTLDASSRELGGAVIPAGSTGAFELTVTGQGNFDGSVSKKVYVAESSRLMSKAVITLGKNLKKIEYKKDSPVKLTSASKVTAENRDNVFTVRFGEEILEEGKDYEVSYERNDRVGDAVLIVTGKSETGYYGSKTATFEITGRKFSTSTVTVDNLKDKVYTGKAWTQNSDIILTYNKGKSGSTVLKYGADYTVSYSKNVDKGRATVTFTGKNEAGYSGKFSKTFNIGAADILKDVVRDKSKDPIVMPYSKAGAKPVDEIILTNKSGISLVAGRDYTLSYKDNKASAGSGKTPTVTVKGKGNYTGSLKVPFKIEKADLQDGQKDGSITIECASVAYNDKKPDSYVYKPAVTVKDGKTVLRAGRDYEIRYEKNTQADYRAYLAGNATGEGMPVAVITAKSGANYSVKDSIRLPLQVYKTKLARTNLDVTIGEAVYTGAQTKPDVTVSYDGKTLVKGTDYTVAYGANIKAGKKTGSVVVRGLAPSYGGSVSYTFAITKKVLK